MNSSYPNIDMFSGLIIMSISSFGFTFSFRTFLSYPINMSAFLTNCILIESVYFNMTELIPTVGAMNVIPYPSLKIILVIDFQYPVDPSGVEANNASAMTLS